MALEEKEKKKYKYLEIKDYILQGIYSGEFKADAQLPTERELADRFQVNRMTVKRALEDIEEMNLIERIQGSGSYVKLMDYGLPTIKMISFTEKYKSKDNKLETKLKQYSLKHCRDFEKAGLSKILLIKSSDNVHYFRRLRLLNGKPICVQDYYIPASRIPVISLDSLSGSFYNYVEKELKLELNDGITHVSVIPPDAEIQKILEISDEEPVVSSEHTVYGKHGLPMENSVSYYNYRYYFLDYFNKRTHQ